MTDSREIYKICELSLKYKKELIMWNKGNRFSISLEDSSTIVDKTSGLPTFTP